jgi:uncharacterized membrane protein
MTELTPGIIGLTLGAVSAQTLANFPMSLAMRQIDQAQGWREKVRVTAARPWLVAAIALLAVHMFSWVQVLKLAPLSLVVPLTAFSHVLNAALVGPLLGERVPLQRWLGTGLIVLGILLVVA